MSFDAGNIRSKLPGGKKVFGLDIDPSRRIFDEVFPEQEPLPRTTTGPPPTRQSPEVEIARKNTRERLLRARGRGASQSAGLLTRKPSLNRPVLSDTLG